jgi:hypothetical protein
VWPGATFQQHTKIALPAWSKTARDRRDVFAEWIFDPAEQCKLGTADNSVCRVVPASETTCTHPYVSNASRVENDPCAGAPYVGETVAVNPWLGGDFNPWVLCDTKAAPIQGVPVNERVSVGCHPDICKVSGSTD